MCLDRLNRSDSFYRLQVPLASVWTPSSTSIINFCMNLCVFSYILLAYSLNHYPKRSLERVSDPEIQNYSR